MPETPPNDDEFADLFGSLPTAKPRRSDSSAEPSSGESAPVPGSRRAAREAAAAAAERPAVADTAPRPAQLAAAPDRQPLHSLFSGAQHDADERRSTDRHRADRRKSRIAGWVVLGIVLAIVGGIVAGGFAVWNTYEAQIRAVMGWEEPKDYEEGLATGDARVTIVTGDTGSSISQTLYNAGVTKTPDAFYDYLIKTAQNPTFQPGFYALQQQMTSAAALAALMDPASRQEHTAQLREGLTLDQTLTRLSDGLGMPLADLQAAVADPSAYGVSASSLEGWLFPATYTFDPEASAHDVIGTLVERTVQSLDAAAVPVDQRQQILTIASIIQREARFEADFYKVSRVIVNRLDPSNDETFGKLQMDSTAQYGYNEMHDGTASTSQAALEDDNPWNTYVHAGLPIGPISNPGDMAIDAAMHPADGPWLYFVTVNLDTGETVFTSTYAEHQQAVTQWQEWCATSGSDDC